jgi:predicted transposase YdaD
MPKPFDAVLKGLLERSPPDWPALADLPPSAVAVIDADVSTFSGATDKVLRVHGPPASILHFDFQAGPDRTVPRRAHGYNALLEDRHETPVRSVIVLLRPEADLSNLTGVYERGFPGEPAYLTFRYQVIRVWRLPVERLLAGGLGTLPLAPLSAVTEAELPGVVGRMKQRLRGRPGAEVSDLWTATYVLMGLRFEPPLVDRLLRGVVAMEESTTYQAILAKGKAEGRDEGWDEGRDEGRLQEAKRWLLLMGRERFGEPDARVTAAVEALDDPERLEQLGLRLLKVASWQKLLQLPSRRTRRRKPTA